jgi:hypothetical protein
MDKPLGELSWTPQDGPQLKFVTSSVFEVVYGGARGGGKTDASLGDFALHAREYGANAKGLFVRRTRVALEPTIERARQLYLPVGAEWRQQRSLFRWPSGAVLYFRHLNRDADADAYQGHDYTRVYVEELTQFPHPSPVDKLKATLRSAAGVPSAFRATCNPGGPGHTWVKARYIDPGAWEVIEEVFESPFDGQQIRLSRQYIPAKLTDNPLLLANDPLYVAKLQQSGSAQLVRAWLEGDWSIVEGAFFDNWSSARNVVEPFAVPADWTRFRSLDWGSARPFSVGWWAVAGETTRAGRVAIPRGALVRYREWYGRGSKPNEGLKMAAEAVARGIVEREAGERIAYGVADPAIFASDGGPSIGERMFNEGLSWRRADNARVARGGAIGGWDQMRARISGDADGPGLVVFSTCLDFIRTVPVLQHDAARPEDVDTNAEDHAADEARYACMSRPYAADRPRAAPETRMLSDLTFNEALAIDARRRREED